MFGIGKYLGTHRARQFFTETMEQRFDVHVVFRNKRVNEGVRGTDLETIKSCDFRFLALLGIGCLLIIFSVVRTNHSGTLLDTDSLECDLTNPF